MPNALFMTQAQVDALPNYEWSDPTGYVYNGQLMKFTRHIGGVLHLVEYVEIGKLNVVGIRYTAIVLTLD